MNLSAKLRRELCRLPSLLPFPPSPTEIQDDRYFSGAAEDNIPSRSDGHGAADVSRGGIHDDGGETQEVVWNNQQPQEEDEEEDQLMEAACEQIQWLIGRLDSILKDSDDGTGRREEEAAVVENNIRQLFGKRVADIVFAAGSSIRAAQTQHTQWEYTWNIFDLQHLSIKCKKLLEKDDLANLLLEFLEKEIIESKNHHDKEMCQCWNQMLKDPIISTTTLEDTFLLPHRHATSRILSLFNTNNAESDELKAKSIHNYLLYRAARTLEHLEHFTLPSLQKQLLLQEKCHNQQQKRHKQFVKMNNDSFERWDDYCMNVLGVESDELPLFPEVNNTNTELGSIIDEYAREVGRSVVDSMRSELERLSGCFLQSLTNTDDALQDAGSSTAGGMKCYGKDTIVEAIVYYRQFTKFLAVASGAKDDDDTDKLSTLDHFVIASSCLLLSQFTTSATPRTNLVSDLQQLEAFLSSRKRELSSSRSSSTRSGRDVVDTIELEWTQYCIRQGAASSSLEGISLDDVTEFHSVIHSVSMQIVGDTSQAKRLCFLADTVGLPTDDDVHGCLIFQSTCRKAARLAHRMTLYQDQQEASANMTEACVEAIGLTKEEISGLEHRMKWIREGLNESDGDDANRAS